MKSDTPARAQAAFPDLQGDCAEMRILREHMLRVARDGLVTVLVGGESGTGKERVAQAIHRASDRHRAPFVVVNCAGLASALVEDQLFGHMRGAFTGAITDQAGPFERGTGGTVFLDEIGELGPDLQIKLLRVLQQRRVQRLGGCQEVPFDVRLIAATHVDLKHAVRRGQFREDLFYRLNVYELHVPPLRRRGVKDLQMLATELLAQFATRRQRAAPAIADAVIEAFARYSWPGNVRELENTLERMIVAADGAPELTGVHLPPHFATDSTGWAGSADRHGGDATPAVPPSRARVQEVLRRHGQVRGRAARELGLSRHQLYRLLTRHATSSAPPAAHV